MNKPFDQDEINNWIDDLCVEPKPMNLQEKIKERAYVARLTLGQKFQRVTAPIWGFVVVCSMVTIFAGSALAETSCDGYTVKSGDTLWNIAMDQGVEVSWITSMNDIANEDLIYVGQCLSLPGIGRTYVVESVNYVANNFLGDGPTPGAIALGDALQTVYPQWGRTIDPTYGIGIWNPRAARGGTSPSTHSSGLALDFYVYCDGADVLFDNLVENAHALGVERIILCGDYWRIDNGIMEPSDTLVHWHDGTLAPAHAHIELTIAAGESLTYEDALAILRN